MKIRTDFVTNSSSSSFITIELENEVLDAYFKENKIDKKIFYDLYAYILGADGQGGSYVCGEGEFGPERFSISAAETFYDLLSEARVDGWYKLSKDKYQALKKYIKDHREEIDNSKGKISIESSYIVTDGVGSYYARVAIEDGKAQFVKCKETDDCPAPETEDKLSQWAQANGENKTYDSKDIDVPFGKKVKKPDMVEFSSLSSLAVKDKTFYLEHGSIHEDLIEHFGGILKKSPSKSVDYFIIPDKFKHEQRNIFKRITEFRNAGVEVTVVLDSTITKLVRSGKISADGSRLPADQYKQSTLIIPEGTTEIEDFYCFCNNKVEEVVIPDTVKRIGRYAFFNCINLKTVKMGDGVELIDEFAFGQCLKMEDMHFSDNLKTIGKEAFISCPGLVNLVLPKGLETIGESAFYCCSNLKNLSYSGTLKTLNKEAFNYASLSADQYPKAKEITPSLTPRKF